MSLLLITPDRDMRSWKKALLEIDPDLDVEIWPDDENRERVQFIVSWKQPKNVFSQYPNLKAVSSLGAGVDHLINADDLPQNVALCRVVSESLVRQMQEYILSVVLSIQRNMFLYTRQKLEHTWKVHNHKSADSLPVGIMGLGKLGRPVGEYLRDAGYSVHGWAASRKNIQGIHTYAGNNELDHFLSKVKILICLLPLNDKTRGILDLDVLRQIQRAGYLINVARGEHLVEEDLIYALDKGWLGGACLDVFEKEPLPEQHPFWNRSNVMITPHVASLTPTEEVAPQIVENYKRVISGMELINKVDREKGY